MALKTQEALQEAFLEATRKALQRDLETPHDWDRYKSIVSETDARLAAEEHSHAQDYVQRIAEAEEIILREEHSVRLDQLLPPGVQRQSDAETLQRKADDRVRQDYDRRLAAVRKDELQQYRDLTAEIRARRVPENAPDIQRDWNRSVRRSGPTQT